MLKLLWDTKWANYGLFSFRLKQIMLCVCVWYKRGSYAHGWGCVNYNIWEVWSQRLQMGHNEGERPERRSFSSYCLFLNTKKILLHYPLSRWWQSSWRPWWANNLISSFSLDKRRFICLCSNKGQKVFFSTWTLIVWLCIVQVFQI